MKTCSKCGETKALYEFSKHKAGKDGLRPSCKACVSEHQRAYNKANREKVAEQKRAYKKANKDKVAEYNRAYREANRQKFAEWQRANYQANKEEIAEQRRAWGQANRDKVAARNRAYYNANKEKVNERRRAYQKKRLVEDPAFAMVSRLRRRLTNALSGQAKPASTMELVGCSTEKLCAWLEMHFAEGMTWENRSEWHIDHIKPIASFEDPADPACWHWSNLQPLWAKDNLSKGDRV